MVEETFCPLYECFHSLRHIESQVYDVHSWADSISACFCFTGVNFLPQFLHNRIRRIPMVLVRRTPLLILFVDPHRHLNGLPRGIISPQRDVQEARYLKVSISQGWYPNLTVTCDKQHTVNLYTLFHKIDRLFDT